MTTLTSNPADRPHVYHPRVLTADNLTRANHPSQRNDPWAVKDPSNRPCDTCGGSRVGLRIHVDPQPRPNLARALAAAAAYAVPA